MEWFQEGSKERGTLMFQTKLLVVNAVVYFVWLARNKIVHDEEVWTVEECSRGIIEACKERVKVMGKSTKRVDMAWKNMIQL